jgi:lysophospholipase L1-like esterase
MTIRGFSLAAGLGAALVLAGCNDELLMPPPVPSYTGGGMFARYVSFGNSITAGLQSGGLSDSLQQVAYPVLLAKAMGTPFNYPKLNNPGCPPPITVIFTSPPTRLGSLADTYCALRSPTMSALINNVAFPGADVLELLNSNYAQPQPPASSTDAYKLFLLGGLTEIQVAREVRPTFVTVWIGNNDVLGAILDQTDAGSAADITPPAVFATRYSALLDSIDFFGSVKGGALIGVVQVAGAPYVSQGRYYYAAQGSIPTLTVLPNCLDSLVVAPGDTVRVLVPFHYGAPIIGAAAAGSPQTLDCSVPQVISVAEAVNMFTTVLQYNQTISQAAAARNWLYLDPNPLLQALAANPAQIRPFPAFPPDPNYITAPFGTAISRDGIHPSTSTQRLIAQSLQQAINAKYSSAIPAVP